MRAVLLRMCNLYFESVLKPVWRNASQHSPRANMANVQLSEATVSTMEASASATVY
jgi:hypothetical protein